MTLVPWFRLHPLRHAQSQTQLQGWLQNGEVSAWSQYGQPHGSDARRSALVAQVQVSRLNQVLLGHYDHYGLAGNWRSLRKVYRFVRASRDKTRMTWFGDGSPKGSRRGCCRRRTLFIRRGCCRNPRQLIHCFTPLVGGQMSVSNGHCHAAVPEKFANGIERHARLYKARCKMVAQIMPPKPCRYLCLFQQGRPCCLETRRDREYTIMVQVLLTPSLQRFESFVIQRDMTSVTGLR